MKLYHSSNVSIKHPDTKHSRLYLDSGRGFYLTSLHEQAVRYAQCARIIVCISEMYGVSLAEATDIYYNSETANLIEDGVADLHCRSDKYLAEEV